MRSEEMRENKMRQEKEGREARDEKRRADLFKERQTQETISKSQKTQKEKIAGEETREIKEVHYRRDKSDEKRRERERERQREKHI